MSILPVVIALVSFQAAEPTREIVSKPHGLSFKVPKEWKVKQTKDTIRLTEKDSTIEIYATYYRQPEEDWQKLQTVIADQLQMKVDRQWSVQILGVPMLLTQTSGKGMIRLTGLLYAATKAKFHFRLDSPDRDFEAFYEKWKECLVTLRTQAEALPPKEDGSTPLAPAGQESKTTTIVLSTNGKKVVLSSGTLPFEISNRSGVFRFDSSWTMEQKESNLTLTHPKLSKPALIEFHSLIDSRPCEDYVRLRADTSIVRFSKVDIRDNIFAEKTVSGSTFYQVSRIGLDTESKPLVMLISGSGDDRFYWTLDFESNNPVTFAADKKLLLEFARSAGFEPAP